MVLDSPLSSRGDTRLPAPRKPGPSKPTTRALALFRRTVEFPMSPASRYHPPYMLHFPRVAVLLPLALTVGCTNVETLSPTSEPETETDPIGPSVEMHAEAGFIKVPPQVQGPANPAMMFYSFHPADTHPERSPLMVFFNGGPGTATSGGLLAYGTGPMTLSAQNIDAGPVPNPASFTQFANVLYLDERDTGFSYDLGLTCSGTGDHMMDAGDFAFAVLDFLDSHPPLSKARVVLTGESFGGTRAPAILFAFQSVTDPTLRQSDRSDLQTTMPWLLSKLTTHLDTAFPGHDPGIVAEQFGWEVLIQPDIAGTLQLKLGQGLSRSDPGLACAPLGTPDATSCNRYDVRMTQKEGDAIDAHTAQMLRSPEALQELLGVAPENVVGLGAADRGSPQRTFQQAFSSTEVETNPNDESLLRARLGELGSGDAYWLPMVRPDCGFGLSDTGGAAAFFGTLPQSHAFITNARYDAVVYSPAIPEVFRQLLRTNVEVDEASPAGAARPGVIRIPQTDGPPLTIRFARYEAGHEVAKTAGPELAADVEAWLRETGALTPIGSKAAP